MQIVENGLKSIDKTIDEIVNAKAFPLFVNDKNIELEYSLREELQSKIPDRTEEVLNKQTFEQ